MLALVLSLALGAGGEGRLLGSEVAAGVGVLGSGYSQLGERLGDAQLAPELTGRFVIAGFTAEAGALLVSPLGRDGLGLSFTGALKVGYTGERWNAVVGALAQWTRDAKPAVAWLPTLRATYDFGPLGLTLGVFDHLGLVPAHLSFELSDLGGSGAHASIGWVAPIGLVASVDAPLPATSFALRFTGFAWKLAQAESAFFSVGLVFGGAR